MPEQNRPAENMLGSAGCVEEEKKGAEISYRGLMERNFRPNSKKSDSIASSNSSSDSEAREINNVEDEDELQDGDIAFEERN